MASMKAMRKPKKVIFRHQVNRDNVASASQQLSASSEQMSRGTAEQAGRANQIASSSTEMSQTVVDIAKMPANNPSLNVRKSGRHNRALYRAVTLPVSPLFAEKFIDVQEDYEPVFEFADCP